MSKHANIILVINLGCEMLYVVDQRLEAQKIPSNRGMQVLTDITEVLFNDQLLDELMAVQTLENHDSVKILLEDIASVSIMRLDQFSMNKLWDLMTMMLKWQISLTSPEELAALTKRHLQGVRNLPLQQAISKVDRAIGKFESLFQDMTIQELSFTRNALMFWLNDFRTKVSILLRLGLQRNDGSFVLPTNDTNVKTNSRYLKNLGQNFYVLYNNMTMNDQSVESLEQSCISGPTNNDLSELSFVKNFLAKDGKESKKIKFNLKLISIEKTEHFRNTSENDNLGVDKVCYIQSKPNQNIENDVTLKVDDKINIGECSDSVSSIHEDLLLLLDEDQFS